MGLGQSYTINHDIYFWQCAHVAVKGNQGIEENIEQNALIPDSLYAPDVTNMTTNITRDHFQQHPTKDADDYVLTSCGLVIV